VCSRESARKWYKDNPSFQREYSRKYTAMVREAHGFHFKCSHTDDLDIPCRNYVRRTGDFCGIHGIWISIGLRALPIIPPTFTPDWNTMINELNINDQKEMKIIPRKESINEN